MEYRVKTLHQSQKFEDIGHNDEEFETILNSFASDGFVLDKVIPDEKYISERDAKKVYVLVFIKKT